MGMITIQENQIGYLRPETDFVDTGWVIGAGIATHYPCNPGKMVNITFLGLVIGQSYPVTFDVLNYVSGGVNVSLGTANGATRSANGTYTEDITCVANNKISFYSNGYLSIANLIIIDQSATLTQPVTFSFNEKNKQWNHHQSFAPDCMLKYGNEFFSFKNGVVWKHNSPDVPRMNFYGEQKSAQITFYFNSDPRSVKILQGIIVESNKVWWCPTVEIKPYTGKSLGMLSRIKTDKFVALQGVFYADFLRNMLDPSFGTQLKALLYGEELRGRVAAITIQNDDTDEVILYKVQVKYAPQMLTP